MLPEDGNSMFTLEEAPESKQKDPNDRQLKPINEYISGQESEPQAINLL